MKKYKNKNVLSIVTGIFVTGIILNTFNDTALSKIEGIEIDTFNQEYIQDKEYFENTPITDTILETGISITPQDVLRAQQIENIRVYLSKRNSPLAQFANEFVDAANYYNIDYRLVAAISIIESSGGIHNFKPYNAWGWGSKSFDNFKDGIWSISQGLSKYYEKGADTPQEIAKSYCPPHSVKWGNNVSFVMSQIGE